MRGGRSEVAIITEKVRAKNVDHTAKIVRSARESMARPCIPHPAMAYMR
jgi:hypothetical protein